MTERKVAAASPIKSYLPWADIQGLNPQQSAFQRSHPAVRKQILSLKFDQGHEDYASFLNIHNAQSQVDTMRARQGRPSPYKHPGGPQPWYNPMDDTMQMGRISASPNSKPIFDAEMGGPSGKLQKLMDNMTEIDPDPHLSPLYGDAKWHKDHESLVSGRHGFQGGYEPELDEGGGISYHRGGAWTNNLGKRVPVAHVIKPVLGLNRDKMTPSDPDQELQYFAVSSIPGDEGQIYRTLQDAATRPSSLGNRWNHPGRGRSPRSLSEGFMNNQGGKRTVASEIPDDDADFSINFDPESAEALERFQQNLEESEMAERLFDEHGEDYEEASRRRDQEERAEYDQPEFPGATWRKLYPNAGLDLPGYGLTPSDKGKETWQVNRAQLAKQPRVTGDTEGEINAQLGVPKRSLSAAIPDESGIKAAGIAVIAMDTGRVLMQQRALNPMMCPCGQGVTWDEGNGYQHEDGSVSHDSDEFYGQSVSDLLDQGHPELAKEAAFDRERGEFLYDIHSPDYHRSDYPPSFDASTRQPMYQLKDDTHSDDPREDENGFSRSVVLPIEAWTHGPRRPCAVCNYPEYRGVHQDDDENYEHEYVPSTDLPPGERLAAYTAALEFDPNEGTWEFPGGKLDEGESPRAAAMREFREEVGQDLPPGVFVGAWVSPGGIVVSASALEGPSAQHQRDLDALGWKRVDPYTWYLNDPQTGTQHSADWDDGTWHLTSSAPEGWGVPQEWHQLHPQAAQDTEDEYRYQESEHDSPEALHGQAKVNSASFGGLGEGAAKSLDPKSHPLIGEFNRFVDYTPDPSHEPMHRLNMVQPGDQSYGFQDHSGHTAPSDRDYNASLDNLESMMPNYYEHPEHYNFGSPGEWEAHSKAMKARGNPDQTIRIYRAVPHGISKIYGRTELTQMFPDQNPNNLAEWVSTSKEYAQEHARSQSCPKCGGNLQVISGIARASDILNEGYPTEYGYVGDSTLEHSGPNRIYKTKCPAPRAPREPQRKAWTPRDPQPGHYMGALLTQADYHPSPDQSDVDWLTNEGSKFGWKEYKGFGGGGHFYDRQLPDGTMHAMVWHPLDGKWGGEVIDAEGNSVFGSSIPTFRSAMEAHTGLSDAYGSGSSQRSREVNRANKVEESNQGYDPESTVDHVMPDFAVKHNMFQRLNAAGTEEFRKRYPTRTVTTPRGYPDNYTTWTDSDFPITKRDVYNGLDQPMVGMREDHDGYKLHRQDGPACSTCYDDHGSVVHKSDHDAWQSKWNEHEFSPLLPDAGERRFGSTRAWWDDPSQSRWQQGDCLAYAKALTELDPSLKFGTAGYTELGDGDVSGGWVPQHHFAHDDTNYYDSLGAHPLGDLNSPNTDEHKGLRDAPYDHVELDGHPDDWDEASPEDVSAAKAHAVEHGVIKRVAAAGDLPQRNQPNPPEEHLKALTESGWRMRHPEQSRTLPDFTKLSPSTGITHMLSWGRLGRPGWHYDAMVPDTNDVGGFRVINETDPKRTMMGKGSVPVSGPEEANKTYKSYERSWLMGSPHGETGVVHHFDPAEKELMWQRSPQAYERTREGNPVTGEHPEPDVSYVDFNPDTHEHDEPRENPRGGLEKLNSVEPMQRLNGNRVDTPWQNPDGWERWDGNDRSWTGADWPEESARRPSRRDMNTLVVQPFLRLKKDQFVDPEDPHTVLSDAMKKDWQPEDAEHPLHHLAKKKSPVYKGFIYLIQNERDIDLGNREIANPDDPDGDMSEQSAWWDIEHARKNPALRKEVKQTPWAELELWADKSVRNNKQIKEAVSKLAAGKTEKCMYCKEPSTQEIVHSEGMARIPVCGAHLGKGKTDAANCTPDGSHDPSNVDSIKSTAASKRPPGTSPPAQRVFPLIRDVITAGRPEYSLRAPDEVDVRHHDLISDSDRPVYHQERNADPRTPRIYAIRNQSAKDYTFLAPVTHNETGEDGWLRGRAGGDPSTWRLYHDTDDGVQQAIVGKHPDKADKIPADQRYIRQRATGKPPLEEGDVPLDEEGHQLVEPRRDTWSELGATRGFADEPWWVVS